MKRLLLCILLIIAAQVAKTQSNQYVDSTLKHRDSTLLDTISKWVVRYNDSLKLEIAKQAKNDSAFYPDRFFKAYFGKAFTQINFDGKNKKDGNSASLSFEDGETRMNLNASVKTQTAIYSFGTSLAVSDKSGVIFSGNKPTSGAEFSTSASWLLPSKTLYYRGSVQKVLPYIRKTTLDSIYNKHVIQDPAKYETAYKKLLALNKKLDSTRKVYDTVGNLLKNLIAQKAANSIIKQQEDSLQKTREALVSVSEEQQKAAENFEELRFKKSPGIAIKNIMEEAEKADFNAILSAGGVSSFSLKWISTGISYKQVSYNTYDSAAVFDKRIGEHDFNGWKFNIGYNYYWSRTSEDLEMDQTKGNSFITSNYFNFQYSVAASNTYDELDEENINVIRQYSSNDTVYQLIASSKYRNVTGVEYQKRAKHAFSIQWAPAFGKKQMLGANFIPGCEFARGLKPVFDIHAGLLFHLNSKEDEKTKVNFEIYLALNDLSDTGAKGGTVWERRQIGVSATVPFSKVFFNQ